jgi:transposase-like protein
MHWVIACCSDALLKKIMRARHSSFIERTNRRAKPVGSSWRVDETYIRTRPKTGYLYRAVDKEGKTVESLFHPGRGVTAAMAFFRKAVASCAPRWPRKIMLDGHKPSHLSLRRLCREDHRWKYVVVRTSLYLNNVIEQDHRAIKGRCRPMMGFKSYRTAAVTLAGLELAHRIRKGQFKFGPEDYETPFHMRGGFLDE